jgi:hypothetical protein
VRLESTPFRVIENKHESATNAAVRFGGVHIDPDGRPFSIVFSGKATRME